MFSVAFGAALLVAAAQSDAVVPARKAYAACLNKVTSEHLEKRSEATAFDGAIQGACAREESALRSALVAADRARGFSQADAEEGATLQIDDYLAVAKEDYRGYQESKTKPN